MPAFRPINGQVLVQPIESTEHVSGGIYLGRRDDSASTRAVVISLGAGKRGADGVLVPFDVAVGDTVLLMTYGPVAIRVGETRYLVAGEEHVLGIVIDESST